MQHVKHARSLVRSSVPSVPAVSSVPPELPARRPALERHELHRVVDGDWLVTQRSPAELRGVVAAGLAAVATLPLVTLLLEAWAHASNGLLATIAALPLLALLLVAVTWRPAGGDQP